MPIVSVTDSDGAVGHCLMRGNHLPPAALADVVRPEVLGEDPFGQGRIWRKLARRQRGGGGRLNDRGLGYVDQALWDLVGRKLDVPVWKLIGGARDKVPAYASTMCGDQTPGGLGSPEDYGRFAEQLVAEGYRAIKLHTWMPPVSFAPDLALDIRACQAVRAAVGPDIELMLDPHHWYSRLEARKLGRALEELDFAWLEEPMERRRSAPTGGCPPSSRSRSWGPRWHRGSSTRALSGWSPVPATSSGPGSNDVGGITPTLKIVHLAEAFGMDVEIHGAGSGNLAVVGGAYAGRWYERGDGASSVSTTSPSRHT